GPLSPAPMRPAELRSFPPSRAWRGSGRKATAHTSTPTGAAQNGHKKPARSESPPDGGFGPQRRGAGSREPRAAAPEENGRGAFPGGPVVPPREGPELQRRRLLLSNRWRPLWPASDTGRAPFRFFLGAEAQT